MNETNPNASQPYKTLGTHLKYLREQSNETIAEVSGAVEIDVEDLERIERGNERPSEDILMLLISHFNMQDQEAVQLWELAGYDDPKQSQFTNLQDELKANGKPVVMLLAMDMRTMYSDGLDIIVNKAGLTLSFTQSSGKGQQMPVARIGMSLEQAENTVKLLQKAILQGRFGPTDKHLPPSVS